MYFFNFSALSKRRASVFLALGLILLACPSAVLPLHTAIPAAPSPRPPLFAATFPSPSYPECTQHHIIHRIMLGLYCSCVSIETAAEIPANEVVFYLFVAVSCRFSC